jgi:hypothetical protein
VIARANTTSTLIRMIPLTNVSKAVAMLCN